MALGKVFSRATEPYLLLLSVALHSVLFILWIVRMRSFFCFIGNFISKNVASAINLLFVSSIYHPDSFVLQIVWVNDIFSLQDREHGWKRIVIFVENNFCSHIQNLRINAFQTQCFGVGNWLWDSQQLVVEDRGILDIIVFFFSVKELSPHVIFFYLTQR